MTLIIENVSDEFIPAFKGLAQGINAKCKVDRHKSHSKVPSERLQKAINEVKNGEVERYKDFEAFKKAMQSEISD